MAGLRLLILPNHAERWFQLGIVGDARGEKRKTPGANGTPGVLL